MANWASVSYYIEGDSKRLGDLIELGDNEYAIVKKLGVEEPENVRGYITHIDRINGVLYLEAEEAWDLTDFKDYLEDKLNVRVIYSVEEPGFEVYCTNDYACKYFPDIIKVDYGDDNEYFDNVKEYRDWVSKVIHKKDWGEQDLKDNDVIVHFIERQ